jgi:hypothetical protein
LAAQGEEAAGSFDARSSLDHVILDWNGTLIADAHACWEADNLVIDAFGGRPVGLAARRETLDLPMRPLVLS